MTDEMYDDDSFETRKRTQEHFRLVEESRRAWPGPHRMTNEAIESSRARFDAARELVAAGDLEGARRVYWWPASGKLPEVHWSRTPQVLCRCGQYAPEGGLGLCGYCGGITDVTPTEIPR